MKVAISVMPVLALYVIRALGIDYQTIQLWVAICTLPIAMVFIVAYLPERPWRHWFGTSLLLLACAVLMYATSVVLFRVFGPDYWGRAEMNIATVGLTFIAMLSRTWVLLSAQSRKRSR